MRDDWIPSPSDLGPDPEPLGLRGDLEGDAPAQPRNRPLPTVVAIVVGADDPGLGREVTERLTRMSEVPVIVIPVGGPDKIPGPTDTPS